MRKSVQIREKETPGTSVKKKVERKDAFAKKNSEWKLFLVAEVS